MCKILLLFDNLFIWVEIVLLIERDKTPFIIL